MERKMVSNSMYEAMSPVLIVGRLSGVIPFKYQIESGKYNTILSYPHFLASMLITSLYLCCFFLVISLNWFIAKEEILRAPLIYIFSEKCQIFTGLIVIICINVFAYVKTDKLSRNFELLSEIDKAFDRLHCKRNFPKMKMNFIKTIVLLQVFYIIYVVFVTYMSPNVKTSEDIPLMMVKYSPTYFIFTTQFICKSFIYTIVLNLRALNTEITRAHANQKSILCIGCRSTRNVLQSRNCTFAEKIDLIWKLYANICECSIILNEYFSVAMFTTIAASFLNTLFQTFYLGIYLMIIYNGAPLPWNMALLASAMILANVAAMFMTIRVCNTAEEEGKEASRLVSNMMAFERDEDIANRIHLFSTYMLQSFPRFTALGLFPINNTLLFTIVGAVTTYMVILFQITRASPSFDVPHHNKLLHDIFPSHKMPSN